MQAQRNSREMSEVEQALTRIEAEYREMPDLRLTVWQAHRLWNLESDVCEAALNALVTARFLCRTHDGAYLRRGVSSPARAGHRARGAGALI